MIRNQLQIDPNLGSNAQYFNPFGPNFIHFTLNENIQTLLLNCVNDFRQQEDIKKEVDVKGQVIQGIRASENQKNSIVDERQRIQGSMYHRVLGQMRPEQRPYKRITRNTWQ